MQLLSPLAELTHGGQSQSAGVRNKHCQMSLAGKYPGIFAAYLVDPVDCPCFAPCTSNCYPSALAAIATAGRPVGVSGAEVDVGPVGLIPAHAVYFVTAGVADHDLGSILCLHVKQLWCGTCL